MRQCELRASAFHGVVSTRRSNAESFGFGNPETTPLSIPTSPATAPRRGLTPRKTLAKPADIKPGVVLDHWRRKAEFRGKSPDGADLQWPRNRLAPRYMLHRDQTHRLRPWPTLAGCGSLGLGR